MMFKKNKKADLTVTWVITIILLVIGFAILLLFFFNFNSGTNIDDTVCHESVIFRASLPNTANLQQLVPLKCKTQKICLTNGLLHKADCKDFQGEEGITTIKVSDVHDIEKVYADSMLDCWSMMGEGKVSLFSDYWATTMGFNQVYPSCVICDRIAFDKQALASVNIDPSKINVYEYMLTHYVPGKKLSYVEYMSKDSYGAKAVISPNYNYFNTSNSFKDSQFQVNKDSNSQIASEESLTVESLSSVSSLTEDQKYEGSAILFMEITSPGQWDSLSNIAKGLGIGLGTSAVLAPTTTFSVVKNGGSSCLKSSLACAVLVAFGVVLQQASVASSRATAAMYCGDHKIGTAARNGCSVVRAVPYSAKEIGSYCQVIESTP